MVRAPGLYPVGSGFESLGAYQFITILKGENKDEINI